MTRQGPLVPTGGASQPSRPAGGHGVHGPGQAGETPALPSVGALSTESGKLPAASISDDAIEPPPSDWIVRTFAALAIPNYRLFVIGHGMSLTGSWMRRTALLWVVYELSGSEMMVGLVGGATLLPMLVLSPWAGVLADRYDRQRMVATAQVVGVVVSTTIAALVATGTATVPLLGLLALLGGIGFSFEVPARQSFFVEMVGRRHMANAIALNSALVNLTRMVGPAIAGLMIAWPGAASVFVVDAFSYLVSMTTLLLIRVPRRVPAAGASKGSSLAMMREGFAITWRNRPVRLVLSLLFVTGVFGWAFQTLLPPITQDVLKSTSVEYGLLYSFFGAGAIVGALTTAALGERGRTTGRLFGGVWVMVAGTLVFSFANTLEMMMLGLLVAGFGGVSFVSTGNTYVQHHVDDAVRGRVMGIWAVAFGGSVPLGSIAAGAVAEHLGPVLTMRLWSVALLASSVWLYLLFVRRPSNT